MTSSTIHAWLKPSCSMVMTLQLQRSVPESATKVLHTKASGTENETCKEHSLQACSVPVWCGAEGSPALHQDASESGMCPRILSIQPYRPLTLACIRQGAQYML